MHLTDLNARDLLYSACFPSKQFRRLMGVQPIQGTPQAVIMQQICGDTLS